MLPRYLAVTPEDIVAAASQVFVPDNRLVLTYLPDGPAADSAAIDDEETEDEEVAA
jgi:predicted Zn-dependent peptidase